MLVEVVLTGGRVGLQTHPAHIDGVAVAAHRRPHLKPPGQQLDLRERPVLSARLVRPAPLPGRHVAALQCLQLGQCGGEGPVDLVGAGLHRRCRLVVAPPGVVARQHAFQRIKIATLAQQPVVNRRTQLVGQHLLRQMPVPGPVNQRRGLVGGHRAVKARQLLPRRRCQRVGRLGLLQPGQQALHRQRFDIAVHALQIGQRMLGHGLDQLLDALVAVRQRPVVADEVRVAGRGDLLVGIGDEAARRVALLRQCVHRQKAGPVVARVPARCRRQAAQVVVGPAHRHPAGRDQRDVAGVVGHRHVLLRRQPGGTGAHKLVHRTRSVHRQGGGDDIVVGVQPGPAQRDGIAGPGFGVQRVLSHPRQAGVRDHRPVAGGAHGVQHIGLALDLDDLLPGLEPGPAVGRLVLVGIVGLDALQIGVLHVGPGVGQAPGDVLVLAHQHAGHAGQGGAGDLQARHVDAGEVPQRRGRELEVRITRQQRFAGGGAAAGQHPAVRAHAVHLALGCGGQQAQQAGLTGGLVAVQLEGFVERCVIQAGRHRIARVRRHQLVDALFGQFERQAQPDQLTLPVGAQVPGHHDGPGQAVLGRPGLGLQAQDDKLGRPGAQRADHRVDTVGVSLQRLA